jgi:hypothetical protein
MSGRRLLLAATAICPLFFQNAYANDFANGLIGGVVGGIIAGGIQHQQQQQQQDQLQQQQRMQQQQQLLLQQQAQQIEAERQRAAAEARQRAETARRQAAAKVAADKAAADKAAAATPAAPAGPAVSTQPAPASTTVQTVNVTVVTTLTNDAAEARSLIAMFNAMIEEQRKIAADDATLSDVASQSVTVLEARVRDLQAQFLDKTTQLSRYRTSITPNDPDLRISARKASETYPKVPYYIPGTSDTGEFWIEPLVTEVGDLAFNLKFIDPKSENDKVRASILLSVADVEKAQKGLVNVIKWAKLAHDKRIRRDYTQRAACFPEDRCPADNGQKREGTASTEISFRVYEDGSTAGRIQRNKGLYEDGYNISIDSASMLQAYFKYVLTEGKADFEAGSRTDEQMKQLFTPALEPAGGKARS